MSKTQQQNIKKPAIAIENVVKFYMLHHEKPTFIESLFSESTEKFIALKVDKLDIYKGQKIAIVGKNGSGKTTLLKMICGITQPNQGKINIRGNVVSLIDLEAGFHPDMSGYENIFLNGLVIGMSKNELKEKFDEIVRFADIGNFIDAPLYTYSEGMKLRLGFSIAVHADPDILVLDEMISTGDIGFQKKCITKINTFFKQKKTILTVSHDVAFLEKNYDRFLWLEHGVIKKDGGKEVIQEYKKYWKI